MNESMQPDGARQEDANFSKESYLGPDIFER